MARIDSRNFGPIVDAKRGHRPAKLLAPFTGPFPGVVPDERALRAHQRQQRAERAKEQTRTALARMRARVEGAGR